MKTFRIGNIPLDNVSLKQAMDTITSYPEDQPGAVVVTPNAHHCTVAEKDAEFANICQNALLTLADGMPLLWISKFHRKPLKEKVSGSDLMPKLTEECAKKGIPVMIFGGLIGEAEKAAENLTKQNPGLKVSTYYPPFGFDTDPTEDKKALDAVRKSAAKVIFVGVGAPKQEKWAFKHRHELPGKVLIGIGASIGFCAGTDIRAPVWMQKTGLEWTFRLAREPRRLFARYLESFKVFLLPCQ